MDDMEGQGMSEKNKIWIGLGIALLTTTTLAGGVTLGSDTAVAQHTAASHRAGEGGEGGTAATLAGSDAAYLTQLGLIRGHLNVGIQLYRLGELEASATHMKHPEDELYASLKPALAKRGTPDFDRELSALAETVENKGEPEAVDAAYEDVLTALTRAESAVADPSAQVLGEVIHALIRTAADEYSLAVDDGRIVEDHEYQDALGFVETAEATLERLAEAGAEAAVIEAVREQIVRIKPAFTSVVPPESATLDPSVLHGAAARIEIAILSLKD